MATNREKLSKEPNTPAEILRHELDTLTGLWVYDGGGSSITWRLDMSRATAALGELIEKHERLEKDVEELQDYITSLEEDIQNLEKM